MKVFCATLLVLVLTACPACKGGGSPTAYASVRDLAKDEAAGGHTLARHVGRSDDELRERLSREHISAASTYTDRATAEAAVGAAIAANQSKVYEWVAGAGG